MKKTIISLITSMVVLSMFFITPAKALEETIAFAVQDDHVAVILNAPNENVEAFTLKATFQITAENTDIKEEKVKFSFNDKIKSVVKEYRVEDNQLTIYLSGQENLFAQEKLQLGTIDMDISKDTKVNIKFVKDSLEYVSSSSVLDKPDSQETTVDWGGTVPPSTDDDQETEKPEIGDSESSSDNSIEEDQELSDSDEKPSIEVKPDSKPQVDDIEDVQDTSSKVQTGDQTQVMIYACIALGSLIIVLLITRYGLKNMKNKVR